MNSASRTLAFVAVAVLSSIGAWLAYETSQPTDIAGFSEVGSRFFPEFDDATQANALVVRAYDSERRDVLRFEVRKNEDGVWVIPSHHNYPAEAEERLARTSTSLLGVTRQAVASRFKDDWARFGVVDPEAESTEDEEARGTRLTLLDASDNALVDLIIGKKVEDSDSFYYVREPEKDTTYIAELNIDLSAKFSDWIEPDLLKVTASDIVKLILDNYSIDEARGAIIKKETLEFLKEDLKTTGSWTLVGLDPEKEELDVSLVNDIASNLAGLKIVDVYPKPEGLAPDLRVPPQIKQIMKEQLEAEMQSRGFFIGPDESGEGERIYGNEGEVVAGTDEAVQYTLYFGEIARDSAKDIDTGLEGKQDDSENGDDTEDSDDEGDDNAEDAEDSDEGGPRRFLMVKVELNEELLGPKPVAPVEPEKPAILKESEESGKPKDDANTDQKSEAKPQQSDSSADQSKKNAAEESPKETNDTSSDAAADDTSSDDSAQESGSPQDDTCGLDEDEPAASGEPAAQESTTAESPAGDEKTSETPANGTADEKPATNEQQDAVNTDEGKNKSDEQPAGQSTDEGDTGESKKDDAATSPQSAESGKKEADDQPQKSPREIAQEEYDRAMEAYNAAKQTYETELKQYEEKLEAGRKKVEELSRRFAKWYYVITGESFEKFKLTRKDFVSLKKKSEEESAGSENQ